MQAPPPPAPSPQTPTSQRLAVIASSLTRYRQGDPLGAADALSDALADAATTDDDLQALSLHLLALLRCEAGAPADAVKTLGAATRLELSQRYRHLAEHTSHQGQLLQHLKGNLTEAKAYYRSTFNSSQQANNLAGMALVLRSLGELALLTSRHDQARSCWERSRQLMSDLQWPDLAAISQWLTLLNQLSPPPPQEPPP
jgi:tetratricopeptide (TPR) repeat protein